jgi:hypothetical protein
MSATLRDAPIIHDLAQLADDLLDQLTISIQRLQREVMDSHMGRYGSDRRADSCIHF